MYEHYRTVVLTGAVWICAGTIFSKHRQRSPRSALIRPVIDLAVILILFISPFFQLWFSRRPENYINFVIRFSELIFFSLLCSLPVDRALREKDYRSMADPGNMKRMDLFRSFIGCQIIAFGLLVFEGTTALTYLAGASIPLQILLPSAALLLYRGLFLLFRRIRKGKDKTEEISLRKILIRVLQGGIFLFYWIRIVLQIETRRFTMIAGIPEETAQTLAVITLVTCALALIGGLQILYGNRSR